MLRWRKVGQQLVGGEPIGAGQPNFVIQGGELDYALKVNLARRFGGWIAAFLNRYH